MKHDDQNCAAMKMDRRILIVDMNKKERSLGYYEFVLPIIACLQDHELDIRTIHLSRLTQNLIDEHHLLIFSGVPMMDHDYLKNIETFSWLRECKKPMIGVCAGMQFLACIHGSKLGRSLGIGMTRILKERGSYAEIHSFIPSEFMAYELHQHAVLLSDEFTELAGSENCGQIIAHREKPIYGFLFHPEVRNVSILTGCINYKVSEMIE